MDNRVPRFDYMCSRIDFDASEISPHSAPASRTSEGYLVVDAYTARDGTLEYSDGENTWIEYRPRQELQKSAESFNGKPVTDEHPERMINSETWKNFSKGVHMSLPTVEVVDGVGYLRAKLLITDSEMIKKIDSGTRELSIGFTSVVVPCEEGISPDGVPCAAVQTAMQGNHVAVVDSGRAGPEVRILMDGKSTHVPSHKEVFMKKRKNDAVAAAAEAVPVQGPDGQEAMLPPWAAAAILELKTLRETTAPEVAAPEVAAPEVAAPEAAAPEAAVPDSLEEAPAPLPSELLGVSVEDLEKALLAKKGEASTDNKQDSVKSLVRKRAKLERLASQAGVAEEVLDSDDEELSRAFIAARLPFARLDGLSSGQIDTIVGVAASVPTASGERITRTTVQAPRADSSIDPLIEAELRFLKSQGYDN